VKLTIIIVLLMTGCVETVPVLVGTPSPDLLCGPQPTMPDMEPDYERLGDELVVITRPEAYWVIQDYAESSDKWMKCVAGIFEQLKDNAKHGAR
jgi:hypothetical protein